MTAGYFQLRLLCISSHKFMTMKIFFLEHLKFKNHPQRRVFCNVNLSNLEEFTKKSKNKQGQGVDFYSISMHKLFKNFSRGSKHGGTFVGLMYVPVYPN